VPRVARLGGATSRDRHDVAQKGKNTHTEREREREPTVGVLTTRAS
jgi:hypothetical protein